MEIKNIEFSYESGKKVLEGISFKVEREKITTIIGANGCGKSTLFNVMSKNLKPQKGVVTLNGENIDKISLKRFARELAIVHQHNSAPADIRVEKLISYGRIPHRGCCKRDYAEDERCINFALETMGIEKFRRKRISELSGGERQRVWIAMALAQNTKILLLDEMTTYLDIKNQIETLRLIKKLNREYKITIIMILHDINQAAYYSDSILAMKNSKIIKYGKPSEVITSETIKETYGVELEIESFKNRRFVITV
ncbi:MAG: ABC transporter ATP-binding protein [Clostridiales bacterium]|nr:ABC transporter ATP-binding protein [Clostridiales bacterium]